MKKYSFIVLFLILAVVTPSSVSAADLETSTKNIIYVKTTWFPGFTSPAALDCEHLENYINGREPATLPVKKEYRGLPLVVQNISSGGGVEAPILYSYYSCSLDVITRIQIENNTSIGWAPRLILGITGWILQFVNWLATFLLELFGDMVFVMIGQGKFITNDIVKTAWPFVQGIANLGFIFALLYIALATTLRIETVSTSVQRLLPKLLLGALLVNFSLVIGGLVIDASRLVMAAEIRLMSNGNLNYQNFTAEITKKTRYAETGISWTNYSKNKGSFSAIMTSLVGNTAFILLMTIAMGIIAINLFVRYVALLILLILSPFAYLAIALPQTQGIVKQWWSMFLKWVLYGPIVLFFLIVITQIQNVGVSLLQEADGNKTYVTFFNQFIHLAIVISLFFVANSVGKKVAGVGSDAVMGFAKKHPNATLAAGNLLTGGIGSALMGAGAGYLAKGTAHNIRDFGTITTSNFMKKTRAGELFGKGTKGDPSKGIKAQPKWVRGSLSGVAKFIAGPERDEKGNLKKGEDSLLSPYGEGMFRRTDAIKATNAVTILIKSSRTADIKTDPALDKAKLIKKSVATSFSKKQLSEIIPHMSSEQLKALLSHSDVVRKLDDGVKAELLAGEYGDIDKDKNDIAKMVDSRVRSIENQK